MPEIVGSFVPFLSNLTIAFFRVGVSVVPKLESSAFVVRVFRLSQNTQRWLTLKPSRPGLDAPFITLKRPCVSSLVESIPSIVFASILGIFLLSHG